MLTGNSLQVRCCAFDQPTQRLATLDVSGTVCLWDPHSQGDMRTVRQFSLDRSCREECTCMLLDHQMLAVGARHFVSLYDPRRKDAVASVPLAKIGYHGGFPPPNTSSGAIAARSVGTQGCLLSVGLSSSGALLFLDKRKLGPCVAEVHERWCGTCTQPVSAVAECALRAQDVRMPQVQAAALQRDTICAGVLRLPVQKCICKVAVSHDAYQLISGLHDMQTLSYCFEVSLPSISLHTCSFTIMHYCLWSMGRCI